MVSGDDLCERDDTARGLIVGNPFSARWTNEWNGEENEYVIPYLFEAGYEGNKTQIRETLKDFERSTCIRLEETEVDTGGRLKFIDGIGCTSYVGKKNINIAQTINMQVGKCEYGNTPLHEVMHAFGFWHEQQRPDRDEHVIIHSTLLDDINYQRIDEMSWDVTWDELNPKSEYDFSSIMHYPSWVLHSDGKPLDGRPNIATKNDEFEGALATPGATFSQEDIRQLKFAYPCGENQCALGNHDCDLTKGDCINLPEGFRCGCLTDFVWNEQNQACENICETASCVQANQHCEPLESQALGYYCACDTGFFWNDQSLACEDKNQCDMGTHQCVLANTHCVLDKYQTLGYRCECDIGFFWNDQSHACEDKNQCEMGTHKCVLANEHCVPDILQTLGYRCQCDIGFSWNDQSHACEDKNECEQGTHTCDNNAICVNTHGSFNCLVDECALKTHTCDENASCTDTHGAYTCRCNSGFLGDGQTCSGTVLYLLINQGVLARYIHLYL